MPRFPVALFLVHLNLPFAGLCVCRLCRVCSHVEASVEQFGNIVHLEGRATVGLAKE